MRPFVFIVVLLLIASHGECQRRRGRTLNAEDSVRFVNFGYSAKKDSAGNMNLVFTVARKRIFRSKVVIDSIQLISEHDTLTLYNPVQDAVCFEDVRTYCDWIFGFEVGEKEKAFLKKNEIHAVVFFEENARSTKVELTDNKRKTFVDLVNR